MLNRRNTLKIGAVAGIAAALPMRHVVEALAGTVATPPEPFTVPLPISPVLEPVRRDRAGDHYEMTVEPGAARIMSGVDTPVLTFDGSFPGPTIRATRGRPATVTVTNALSTPATVHLHGADVPQSSDGHPLDFIPAGGSRTYHYPNHQPAATMWYHDHTHHLEAEQVYRGLSGFYILDDPASTLPSGAYDLPIAIRDAAFSDNGELHWQLGGIHDRTTILVNGAVQPVHTVERRRYRLRLLNSANERELLLRFGGAEVLLIGLDGGLLPRPVKVKEVFLTAAQRAEVIVDFGRFGHGSSVIMENVNGTADVNTELLKFNVVGDRITHDMAVPAVLPGARVFPAKPTTAVTTRKVVFSFDRSGPAFKINGRTFDPHRVDFTVKQGSTEIWEISTEDLDAIPHSLHVHLVQFRVLDRDGVPVGAAEGYPRDTVFVPVGQVTRILINFDSQYTGRYLFHCHMLDHAAVGMMAQMEIVP